MIDITLLILLILFPVFTIIIGWRLIGYYISDDFAKGFYMGKIVFVMCTDDRANQIVDIYHGCLFCCMLFPDRCCERWWIC